MRCQKVRSYLSAYCKGELNEKRTGAIKAHLGGCPRCRFEEAAYRELNKSIAELQEKVVSDNFNSLLLKRVADERFKENRTKAFMPKKVPVVSFGRLAPVIAAACFIFAFVFSGGLGIFTNNPNSIEYVNSGDDDSYMKVQPETDHVLNQANMGEWAFNKEVARATRINGLINQLSNQGSFGSLASSSRRNSFRSPFQIHQYPSLIRTYQYPQNYSNRRVDSSR